MDKDNKKHYYLSIPLSKFPVYQLLSHKYGLTIHCLELEKNSSIPRIKFALHGNVKGKESFYKDLDRLEIYEDKLEKIFTE